MTVFVGTLYKYFVKRIRYVCYKIHNYYFCHKCCWFSLCILFGGDAGI